MRVDLNDVELFVEVVRATSFSEAGRRLSLPPNTVSRRIRELEGDLGLRLFHRSTRRLSLTDTGRELLDRSAEHVEALTRLADDLAQGRHTPRGKVRIAAMADFFDWFSVSMLNEFLAAHAAVQLEFVLSDSHADLLSEGIDVAFRAGMTAETNLIAKQIGWGSAILVASPAYLRSREMPDSLTELAEHDCITSPTGDEQYSTWRLNSLDDTHEISVRGRLNANSTQARLNAAVAGLGIALIPVQMVAEHLKSGRLHRILPGFGMSIGVYAVYLTRRQLPRAVSEFIEFVTTKMIENGFVRSDKYSHNEAVSKPHPGP